MSIDVKTEDLIPFCEACTAFPGGKRLSLATLHRWRSNGVRGVKLETILVGGSRYTSGEGISRFIASQNATDEPVPSIAAGQRQRQSQAARKELAKLGVGT